MVDDFVGNDLDWLDDLEVGGIDGENAGDQVGDGDQGDQVGDGDQGGDYGDETENSSDDSEHDGSDNEQQIDIFSIGLNAINVDGERDCVESEDELRSLGSNSDDEGSSNLLVYREGDEKKIDFKYQVGMIFSGNKQFKWVVEVHEALNKKSVKFIKNDKRRVQAKCRVDHCNWSIFASKSNTTCPFTIKSINKHTCAAQQDNKLVTSAFLAKFYKEEFKDNQNWGRKAFQK